MTERAEVPAADPAPLPSAFHLLFADGAVRATWEAGSVPARCQVQLLFVDAAGGAVTPAPTVEYSAGAAVVTSGLPTAEGSQVWAHAQVVSLPTPTAALTVHELSAATAVVVGWRTGALQVTWTYAGTTTATLTFDLEVRDASGQPLTAQPSHQVTGAGAGTISAEGLTDGSTYIVAVRPTDQGSEGPWAQSAPYRLDESLPDSDLLRALLLRIEDAKAAGGGSLVVDEALLGPGTLTALFEELLGYPGGAITVTTPEVGSTAAEVTLSGAVALLGSTQAGACTFTDVAGVLQVVVAITVATPTTITALADAGFLVGSAWTLADWAATLAPFPSLTFRLDSSVPELVIDGEPTAEPWNIVGGLPQLGIGTAAPDITIVPSPDAQLLGTPKTYRQAVHATLHVGTGASALPVPTTVVLPTGAAGWSVVLGSEAVDVMALDQLEPLLANGPLGLPSGFVALDGFTVDHLSLEFAPVSPARWRVGIGVSIGNADAPAWTPVPGVALQRLAAVLDAEIVTLADAPSVDLRGAVVGFIELGASGASLAFGIAAPTPSGGFRIEARGSVNDFSISSLAGYLGGDTSSLTAALTNLGTIGTLSLDTLRLDVATSGTGPPVTGIAFGATVSEWTFPVGGFSVTELSIGIEARSPMTVERSVQGWLTGLLQIGAYPVAFELDFDTDTSWTLQLGASHGQLAGLSDVNALVTTAAITSLLPSDLPTTSTFGLAQLAVTYDTADGYLTSASMELVEQVPWSWFGGKLTLWDASIALEATWASKAAAMQLTGSIDATFSVGGATFEVWAISPAVGSPWEFGGRLDPELDLALSAAATELVGKGTALPSGFGFPTEVVIDGAEVYYVPSTGELSLWMQSSLPAWTVSFAGTQLSLTTIGARIQNAGGTANTTAAVYGAFDIGSCQGMAEIAFGSGATDFEIGVQLLVGVDADAATIVNETIGGTNPFGSVLLPQGFAAPAALAEVDAQINLTQRTFLVWGQYAPPADLDDPSLYGAAALLVAPKTSAGGATPSPGGAEPEWGFVLAATLQGWTFARLSENLRVVDQILGVNSIDAAIAISSLDEGAAALVSEKVPALPADLSLLPGLNLSARLDFSKGTLTELVASTLNVAANAPAGGYLLVGRIPQDTSASTFSAQLGDLTLFSTIAFTGLELTLTLSDATELKISGGIAISLGTLQLPPFQSELVVSSTGARFVATSTEAAPQPLGMFGIQLQDIGLDLSCTFDDAGAATDVSTSFTGHVTIGTLPLKTTVAIVSGSAAVVIVELVNTDGTPASVGIGELLAQAVGATWPAGSLDVTLSNGSITYAPAEIKVGATTYPAGFHANADVTILFLPTVTLAVDVYARDARTDQVLLSAAAAFTKPLDFFGAIQLRGATDATKGPGVAVQRWQRSTEPTTSFQLEAGVDLFGTPVASATIDVGATQLSGSVTIDVELPILGTPPPLEFTWSEADGFSVTGWSFPSLDLGDFSFTNVPSSTCEVLEAIAKLPVTTNFDASISFGLSSETTGGTASSYLTMSIGGTFGLVITRVSEPVLSVTLVPVDLKVPLPTTEVSWAWVGDQIGPCLQNAAAETFKAVLANKENVAKILAAEGAVWAAEKAVDMFVCSGVEDAIAEQMAAAAAGAVVSDFAVGGATIAVGGVAGAIVGGVFTNGGGGDKSHHGSDPPPPPQRPPAPTNVTTQQRGDQLTIGWEGPSGPGVGNHVVLTNHADGSSSSAETSDASTTMTIAPGVVYDVRVVASLLGYVGPPSSTVTVPTIGAPVEPSIVAAGPIGSSTVTGLLAWAAPPGPGGLTYVASLEGMSIEPTYTNDTASFPGLVVSQPTTFTASVHAAHGSDVGPPATAAVTVLPPLAGLALVCRAGSLIASWDAPASLPQGYSAHLAVASTGQPVEATPVFDPVARTATFSGEGIAAGQTYQAIVCATGPGTTGLWAETNPATVVDLATPSSFEERSRTGPPRVLALSWAAVSGAQSYGLRFLDSAHVPLPEQPPPPAFSTDAGRMAASIDVSSLPVPDTYVVEVTALADQHAESLPGQAPVDLQDVPAPVLSSPTIAGTDITVSWPTVPTPGPAVTYDLEVLAADGTTPVSPAPPITITPGSTEVAAVITAAALPAGTYVVRVEASIGTCSSALSAPVSVTYQPVVAASMLVLTDGAAMQMPSIPAYDFGGTGALTIALWLRTTAAADDGVLLDRPAVGTGAGYRLSINRSGIISWDEHRGSASVSRATLSPALHDTSWHQVLLVRGPPGQSNQSTVTLVVDGASCRIAPAVYPPVDLSGSGALTIGIDPSVNDSPTLPADLRLVRLWNTVVSPADAFADVVVADSTLVGEWSFADRAPTDTSPLHNGGTLVGDARIVPLG